MTDFLSGRETDLSRRVLRLEETIESLRQRLDELTRTSDLTNFLTADAVWKVSVNASIEHSKMKRIVPVRVYLDDPRRESWPEVFRDTGLVYNAIFRMLAAGGFRFQSELPEESGSWRKYFGAISDWWGTDGDTKRRLAELEDAAKIVLLNKPSAEVTKLHAEAASSVIQQLKEFEDASIQIGNFMILKRTNSDGRKQIIAGPLSPDALKKLEENHIEQMKPENAQLLLEESGKAIAVDQDTIQERDPEGDF
jgi:hypothetical protein